MLTEAIVAIIAVLCVYTVWLAITATAELLVNLSFVGDCWYRLKILL